MALFAELGPEDIPVAINRGRPRRFESTTSAPFKHGVNMDHTKEEQLRAALRKYGNHAHPCADTLYGRIAEQRKTMPDLSLREAINMRNEGTLIQLECTCGYKEAMKL